METGERVVADYELVHLARALEVGVLELLGLEPHKAVILSVVREDLVEEIMNCLEDKFHSVRGGKGICFAVPLSSVIGVNLYQFLSDNRMGREG